MNWSFILVRFYMVQGRIQTMWKL